MPRPPRKPLDEVELKKLGDLAAVGLNLVQIAAAMEMSPGTLKRRIKETEGGSDPLKRGRAVALANVARTAYQLAVSGKVPAMTMFFLKTRGGWREKDRPEARPDLADAKKPDTSSLAQALAEQIHAAMREKEKTYGRDLPVPDSLGLGLLPGKA